jgi:predicted transcriptional regulator of viral defense system
MKNLIEKNKIANWDKFFVELQSQGRYTFAFDELRSRFNLSEETLLQGLYRYKVKKQIAQIRKGFYAIISPEYSKQGMLPPYLFIDDLMKSLNKPYYVALLSAAALHGAAHQQPMEYFVITQTPAPRSINSKKLKISFFSKNNWEKDDIVQKTTNAGYINVASPELTALDLLAYNEKIGLNRATTVLQELAQAMKVSALSRTAKRFPSTPVIQRLGYIFDKVLGEEKLAKSLLKILKSRTIVPVLLSVQKEKQGEIDEVWKVIKNMEIESDL